MARGTPLSDIERQIIELRVRHGDGPRAIARILKRDHSVIVRELRRNGVERGYKRTLAVRLTEERSHKTNKRKLDKYPVLAELVRQKIKEGLSPEQIAGLLKIRPLRVKKKDISVSHEAIYTWMYAGSGKDCIPYLRKHKRRRGRRGQRTVKTPIKHRVSIHKRPKKITERKEVGHWEDDSVICKGKSVLAVQYERRLMLARITKVPDKSALSHEWALRAKIEKDPKGLWKTTTRDNGTENVLHYETKKHHNVKSYFCDTYSSWQKGGVENLNGLIRQYFPKNLNIDDIPQEAIAMVEHLLNTRPRKKLGFLTPNQALERYLAQKATSGALNS